MTLNHPSEDINRNVATDAQQWFVLRDLKRPNAKVRAYQALSDEGFEVYTPMRWVVEVEKGKKLKRYLPVVPDLLFVHASQQAIDPKIKVTPTLQYRFVRGAYCRPMTVEAREMENFIRASSDTCPEYLTPAQVLNLSVGSEVRVVGGMLTGVEGRVLNIRGAHRRRVLIELAGFVAAVVEVDAALLEYL